MGKFHEGRKKMERTSPGKKETTEGVVRGFALRVGTGVFVCFFCVARESGVGGSAREGSFRGGGDKELARENEKNEGFLCEGGFAAAALGRPRFLISLNSRSNSQQWSNHG
jgi:hypothetical protein